MKPRKLKNHKKYLIYEDGTVINRHTMEIIQPYPVSSGYMRVNIKDNDDDRAQVYVHRLVADTFIANPNSHPEVNHLDGDKTNNHYRNLEWTTSKGNKAHAKKMGLGNANRVEIISIQLTDLDRYPALAEYARRHDITPDEVRYRIIGTQRSDDVLLIRLDNPNK